mmetsp:Transcript_18663/g.53661  ORF Transcript_18663/g.53661 Transcript_18663/m.53661 type:complete len:354 (-) Transcript_18663:511-1572(-)
MLGFGSRTLGWGLSAFGMTIDFKGRFGSVELMPFWPTASLSPEWATPLLIRDNTFVADASISSSSSFSLFSRSPPTPPVSLFFFPPFFVAFLLLLVDGETKLSSESCPPAAPMPFLSPSPTAASAADLSTEASANTKSLPSSAVLIRPLDHPCEPVDVAAGSTTPAVVATMEGSVGSAVADAEVALTTDAPLTIEEAVEVFLRSFFRFRLRSLNKSKIRFRSSDANEGSLPPLALSESGSLQAILPFLFFLGGSVSSVMTTVSTGSSTPIRNTSTRNTGPSYGRCRFFLWEPDSDAGSWGCIRRASATAVSACGVDGGKKRGSESVCLSSLMVCVLVVPVVPTGAESSLISAD